jgi:hypothetical protein
LISKIGVQKARGNNPGNSKGAQRALSERMMLSAILGVVGAAFGIGAAVLWLWASCLKWRVGREGRQLGDYSHHPGEFAGPNELGPYFEAVGRWNSRAAIVTAIAILFWAGQTIADLCSRR